MTESYSGGTLNGLSVNSAYNNQLQRASLKMTNGTTELQSVVYGYDSAGRLQTVTETNYSASYAYLANSSLIDTVTFKNGQDTRLITTRRYDRLSRLESISSAAYGSGATNLPISYAYQYNRANQRTRVGLADGAYWVYQYDALGQVISGKKYWSDGTPVAGQQFEYGFDDIGNRLSAKVGGDENGGALRSATYTANRLNQYTQRTNSGGFDVLGLANVGAVIQVNSSTNGVYRRGEYFRKELSVDNSVAAWQGVTNSATLGQDQATETGNVFVPPTPESFAHDADGNLTNDGRWAYVWDAENRLVRMVSRTATPTNSWRALNFSYDYQGRRISKTVSNWNGVAWVKTTDVRFVYDGWNFLAILDSQSSIVQSFVWGLDLSGSLQGAGGVGGLLKISHLQSPNGDYFPAYDGNGNLTALLDAADGSVMANYEYGPFGEAIRANGAMAKANPIRFSSKCTDDESDLVYYGYRYYNPATGRWLSRDPLNERGFKILEGSEANAANRPIFAVWRNTDGTTYAPRLRIAIWNDGRIIFAKDAPLWGTNLFAGRLQPTEIALLKERVRGTGVLGLARNTDMGPSDIWCCLLLDFGDDRKMLHWSEQGLDFYWNEHQPVQGTLPRGDFKRCWAQLNRFALSLAPKDARRWGQSFKGAPDSWYLKNP